MVQLSTREVASVRRMARQLSQQVREGAPEPELKLGGGPPAAPAGGAPQGDAGDPSEQSGAPPPPPPAAVAAAGGGGAGKGSGAAARGQGDEKQRVDLVRVLARLQRLADAQWELGVAMDAERAGHPRSPELESFAMVATATQGVCRQCFSCFSALAPACAEALHSYVMARQATL